MPEFKEDHYYIHSMNKDRLHKKKMEDVLDDLMKTYDSDDIIAYVMKKSEKD